MPFMEWIKWLQDFRSQLENWGVTTGGLIAIGLLAFFFFLLSAREVFGWFLKTGGLRGEIRELRSQVAKLQESIDELREIRDPQEEKPEKISAIKEDPTTRSFRLDH